MKFNVTVIVKELDYRETFEGIEEEREGLAKTEAIKRALDAPDFNLNGQLVEYEVEVIDV